MNNEKKKLTVKTFVRQYIVALVFVFAGIGIFAPMVTKWADGSEKDSGYSYKVPNAEEKVLQDSRERSRAIKENLDTVKKYMPYLVAWENREDHGIARAEIEEAFNTSLEYYDATHGTAHTDFVGDEDLYWDVMTEWYAAEESLDRFYEWSLTCEQNDKNGYGYTVACDKGLVEHKAAWESINRALESYEEYRKTIN